MVAQGIPDVTPRDDGQVISVGDLGLEIADLAGHCADDIAVCDRSVGTIFTGDAIGYRVEGVLTMANFIPPFWDPGGYTTAVDRVAALDYDTICLGHFGALPGAEARTFPREAAAACDAWWAGFAAAEADGRLDDIAYVRGCIEERAGATPPLELEVAKRSLRVMLAAMNGGRRLVCASGP